MGGDTALRAKVEKYAQTWTEFANVILVFGNDNNADIRISFQPDSGSWSAIGTDCHSVEFGWDKPTMNFGWLDSQTEEEEVSRVVLHEFGHALGCLHEHQTPGGGIKWDKPKVYEVYARLNPPWSQAKVDENIFNTYSAAQTVHTPLDRTSIMMYPIDKELTTDGFEVGWNKVLSQTDKDFIRQMYP